VIVRFFTVPKVSDARLSAGYALVLIAILYTTAPAVASFARLNLIDTVSNAEYQATPEWFKNWEAIDLIAWRDKNSDGKIQYTAGNAFEGKPDFYEEGKGASGERLLRNENGPSDNELYIDQDIMVLANPEIADLPNWVVALVVAGGLAAALSTAAGLLLVISTSVAHDLFKKMLLPNITDKQELMFARMAVAIAVLIAGYFGINPPGFVAQVVAFAFGLAASTFFPIILMGIFYKRMNKEGAISGMLTGLVFTSLYIIYFKFINPDASNAENWWFGVSPEGAGTIGMALNFVVAYVVSQYTNAPPKDVQDMIERIRVPRG
jgi:cation/acetate symporter